MVVTGCLSFSATGSFRLPSRAAGVAVGPCAGPGQVYWDSTDGALKVDLGPVGGPGPVIIHRPPTTPGGGSQPGGNPPWVVNLDPTPPVIGPQGTFFLDDDFGSMASAVFTMGLPTAASRPTIDNSVYAFDPGIAALTVSRITIKPRSGGVATSDIPIDVGGLVTTTVTFSNPGGTLSGRFRNTVRAGDGVSDTIITTGNISTQAGNLVIAPVGLTTGITGSLVATVDITGITVNGGVAGSRVILRTGGGLTPEIGTSGGGSANLNLNPDSGQVNVLAVLNSTVGIFTGAGNGTSRLTVTGALVNITTMTMTGAIATPTTVTSSSHIVTTAGGINATGGVVPVVNQVIHGTTIRGGDGTNYAQLNTAAARAVLDTAASTGLTINSRVSATGGVDIGTIVDCVTSLASGDIPLSLRHAGVEKARLLQDTLFPGGATDTVLEALSIRGGTIGGAAVHLNNISGFPAITTRTADTTLYIWPAYPNPGTTIIDTRVALTVNAGTTVVDFVGRAAPSFAVQDSAVATTYFQVSGTSTNVAAGPLAVGNTTVITATRDFRANSLAVGGSTVITAARVLNNLDADGGATGMIVRLNGQTGAGTPAVVNPTISNNREIQEYRDTVGGGNYLIWRNDTGNVKFFVQGTQFFP